MKGIFVIAAILAIVTATYGTPVETSVVDWVAVDAKVEELRGIITNAVGIVRTTALQDNPAVGGVIAERLGVAAGQANAVLGKAKQAIRDQTLTEDEARALFVELQTVLTGLRDDLRDQVNQLSPGAQATINDTLNSAYTQAEAKAREILAMLSQS